MQDTFSGNDEALDKLSQLASVADGGFVRQQLSAFVGEFKITTNDGFGNTAYGFRVPILPKRIQFTRW